MHFDSLKNSKWSQIKNISVFRSIMCNLLIQYDSLHWRRWLYWFDFGPWDWRPYIFTVITPIWVHLPLFLQCQHDIYKAWIKCITTTCNCFYITPENDSSCDISPMVRLIQSTNPLLISPLLVSNYSNRLCVLLQCAHQDGALSEGSQAPVQPSIITDSFRRGQPSLPVMNP